jgi:DtxR family Mn-dependent transcriptional regulator
MEEESKFHTVRGYQLLQQNDNLLTPAMEDYMEMIYRNCINEGYMRINTLSDLLNVAAPSATKMVRKLSQIGLIDYKRYGIILLTEQGTKIGSLLLERHKIIETFLKNIGVLDNELLTETELIEHNVSTSTLLKISIFNQFYSENPNFLNEYKKYTDNLKT